MHLVMVYISLFSHPFIPPTIQPAKNQHGFSTVSALTQKSNTHFYTQWPLHTHIRVWNVTQTKIYIGHSIIPNTQAKYKIKTLLTHRLHYIHTTQSQYLLVVSYVTKIWSCSIFLSYKSRCKNGHTNDLLLEQVTNWKRFSIATFFLHKEVL